LGQALYFWSEPAPSSSSLSQTAPHQCKVMSGTKIEEYLTQIAQCRIVSDGGSSSCADVEGMLKIFGSLPEEARGNKEFVPKVLKLLSAGGFKGKDLVDWFESLPQKFRNDKDAVMGMVTTQGDLLQHTSEALKGDKEVVMLAVAHKKEFDRGGPVLCHASEALRDDKEVVMEAMLGLGQEFKDFEFASERLKGDKDLFLEMVAAMNFSFMGNGEPMILKLASEALRGDKDVVMAIVLKSGDTLQYASDALQSDLELNKAAFGNEVVCLPGDRPVPGVYAAVWDSKANGYEQDITVDDSGKFTFSYDCEANPVQHQLQDEMWNSFPSPIISIAKYKEEYAKHPATIFKLLRIVGPFVHWGCDDSDSTMFFKWTYKGPSTEKTSNDKKAGY